MGKIGVVVFPGTNCDQDCHDAVGEIFGTEALSLWHDQDSVGNVDAIFLPGGFSYGDYLRSGAIARFSPIMKAVETFANKGGPVLGICNGFQILTECGLLPGALIKNQSLQFQCEHVQVRVENNQTPFTQAFHPGDVLSLPIAHGEGNFYAEADTLQQLEENGQIVLRYLEDVNGSVHHIAGICNQQGNVVGMMPHPERNLWKTPLWSGEGRQVFESLQKALLFV